MWRVLLTFLDVAMSLTKTATALGANLCWLKALCIRWWLSRLGSFGGHVPAHREVQGISGVNRSYSLSGSSSAAVYWQYCSNLLWEVVVCNVCVWLLQASGDAADERHEASTWWCSSTLACRDKTTCNAISWLYPKCCKVRLAFHLYIIYSVNFWKLPISLEWYALFWRLIFI